MNVVWPKTLIKKIKVVNIDPKILNSQLTHLMFFVKEASAQHTLKRESAIDITLISSIVVGLVHAM